MVKCKCGCKKCTIFWSTLTEKNTLKIFPLACLDLIIGFLIHNGQNIIKLASQERTGKSSKWE